LFFSLDEVAHFFGWLAKLRLHEFISLPANVCGSFTPFDVESVVWDFYRRDKDPPKLSGVSGWTFTCKQ
jgi:hypothetical protein